MWQSLILVRHQPFPINMKALHKMAVTKSVSSIVNEAIRTIMSLFIFIYFFLRKNIERWKSTKMQNKRFLPSQKFLCVRKVVAFIVFCSVNFVFLVGFCLWCIFVHSKSFRKNKINRLKIVLIASFTILLTCTPIDHPI